MSSGSLVVKLKLPSGSFREFGSKAQKNKTTSTLTSFGVGGLFSSSLAVSRKVCDGQQRDQKQ